MACVAVPNLILILLHTYEMVQRPLWEQEAMCHATPTEQDPSLLCSLPHKPAPFGYYIVKNLAWMFQVVAMVTWVLSKKTLEGWRVFGCSVCGCGRPCGKPVDNTTDSPTIQP